jgi:hypothetical protein
MDKRRKRRVVRRRFLLETIALLLIIGSPFIFKSHEYFTTDPDEIFSFFGLFEITSNGFSDVSTHVWFLLGKIIPLYLLIIWFFTCKHWWYHIILIPICMYAFQIFEVVFFEDLFADSDNILWLLPICMVIIPFVYFVRLKLFDKYVHGIDLEAMDAELQYYKNKEKEELQKAGLNIDFDSQIEKDLSSRTANRVLNKYFKKLQTSLQSLF